ncbi:hypothetical protein AN639_00550 [Candidatus Epulonipiscium fishelsonii]|uniref:Uncharacterized protein n=1 Tax=Candidatus Epulonipiscium fishelsonii TaxID=77094 RepID=A0ACC8XBJ5_9FIRM|nr:hypothetical protein AN396_07210 [Epulopiscium sp. SCG-B11WGA-EpuloA1]ONI41290.1 hypothetical protein AN639_00550 [Epulopiscium sp. SCG-B05WGA-EpuloA1]
MEKPLIASKDISIKININSMAALIACVGVLIYGGDQLTPLVGEVITDYVMKMTYCIGAINVIRLTLW